MESEQKKCVRHLYQHTSYMPENLDTAVLCPTNKQTSNQTNKKTPKQNKKTPQHEDVIFQWLMHRVIWCPVRKGMIHYTFELQSLITISNDNLLLRENFVYRIWTISSALIRKLHWTFFSLLNVPMRFCSLRGLKPPYT